MALTGKWGLVDGNGIGKYYDAIKSPEAHKTTLWKAIDGAKTNPTGYVEELAVTDAAIQRRIFVNGEKKKDSGEIKFGVEVDSKLADGRPARIKVVRDSATKFTKYSKGEGFDTVTTFEVTGDQLTITETGNGATCVTKYKKLQ